MLHIDVLPSELQTLRWQHDGCLPQTASSVTRVERVGVYGSVRRIRHKLLYHSTVGLELSGVQWGRGE